MLKHYNQLLENGQIKPDSAQREVAKRLELLEAELGAEGSGSIFAKLLGRQKQLKGIFIYGKVGRGKSMLMDAFFQSISLPEKRRVHFHEFMQEIHGAIHEFRQKHKAKGGKKDPIPYVAEKIAGKIRLLCLDEYEIHDVADAMILGRLFSCLIKNDVVFVITSNRAPGDHYKNGLQRDRYLKFAEYLKKHVDVIELGSAQDYRMSKTKGLTKTYFHPLGFDADQFAKNTFVKLAGDAKPQSLILNVHGHELKIPKAAGSVALASFSDLCEKPLAAADYMELAKRFDFLILTNIPQMSAEMRNEARRFVMLIDELYENKVKLIATAAVSSDRLYEAGSGSFEFSRTISRLTEMQSKAYLEG